MLQAKDLCVERREHTLFEHLNLTFDAGRAAFFSGGNGTGKTTLLKAFAGLLTPTQGHILWNGQSIYRQMNAYVEQLLYIGHQNALTLNMSVLENLVFLAKGIQSNLDRFTARVFIVAFGAKYKAQAPLYSLSAGQQRRVTLARIFMASHKKIWILDEPFTALDQTTIALLEAEMAIFLEQGGTVLVSSHQPVDLPEHLMSSVHLSTVQESAA